MTRRFALFALSGLALTGCQSQEKTKRYPLRGEIKALDPKAKTATIKHEKIGDWMEAMTMEYPVKPDAEFQKLKVGAHIEAVVVVGESSYYVTEVKTQ